MELLERIRAVRAELCPPRRLDLVEWADTHFYLSPESAAEPGRWRTLPYQAGILRALADPAVEMVTWKKSARVGATKLMTVVLAYHIVEDPCPVLLVEPTIEDAQGFSREELAPMVRDCPAVAERIALSSTRVTDQTLLSKLFPGGILTLVGANSPRGFRRVSRRVVLFDEVDGYPPSAGAEGDQIKLGIARTTYYWNRKIFAASTPTIAGVSRIAAMFEEGDRRRYHVPCPSCGYMDILTFRDQGERGHFMQWPEGDPGAAYFVCRANGCVIEHKDKPAMIAAGEWRAEGEFKGHASFHIWAAYSLAPQATWGQLATEFVEAKRGGPEQLKTFINIALGEEWQDRGEAPDWERLYQRREKYPIGMVPVGVRFLTAGVDVQKDRLEYEVDGWGLSKESWVIDEGAILGDTSGDEVWLELDKLIARTYPTAAGEAMPIAMTGVDSGYNTQQVYNYVRRHSPSRVIATKGSSSERVLVGASSAVDVTVHGRRIQRGARVFPIGVDLAKSELYGLLRLPMPRDGEPFPPGFCHFPELGEEYFKQITAETLITVTKRSGFTAMEWRIQPNRQNHKLDCRIIARACASLQGLDRYVAPRTVPSPTAAPRPKAPPRAPDAARPGGWLGGRPRRPGGWLGKRR